MTDTTKRPAWLDRLIALMDGSICADVGPHDIIKGATWRDFYQNHWPKEFYIDDFRVDFEDERGAYILDDAAEHPLEAFGFAVWHDPRTEGPLKDGTMVDMYLLYAAIMGVQTRQTVSFRVASDNTQALIEAAEALGAEVI